MNDVKNSIKLKLRTWKQSKDSNGYNCWKKIITKRTISADETALIICDMWNTHWCRAAAERVDLMAEPMSRVVKAARQKGIKIIHAPSNTIDNYENTKSRKRILEIPLLPVPEPVPLSEPPLPVDSSDRGSDCEQTQKDERIVWSSQHPAIEIDDNQDVIAEDEKEIYNYLKFNNIKNVIIMGVHANMCVIGRGFGIINLMGWGFKTILVRDMTDSMYNPFMAPYVSHSEGNRLVVEYIEKFLCPSILSRELLL